MGIEPRTPQKRITTGPAANFRDDRRSGGRICALRDRREQLRWHDRLDEVIVGAGGERGRAIVLETADTGEQNARRFQSARLRGCGGKP